MGRKEVKNQEVIDNVFLKCAEICEPEELEKCNCYQNENIDCIESCHQELGRTKRWLRGVE